MKEYFFNEKIIFERKKIQAKVLLDDGFCTAAVQAAGLPVAWSKHTR